jgi:hypothetical protein
MTTLTGLTSQTCLEFSKPKPWTRTGRKLQLLQHTCVLTELYSIRRESELPLKRQQFFPDVYRAPTTSDITSMRFSLFAHALNFQ